MTARTPLSEFVCGADAAGCRVACEMLAGITRGLQGSNLSAEEQVTAIALGIERAVRAMEEAFAPELRWALARRFAQARPRSRP
jgi:hypothetical protein